MYICGHLYLFLHATYINPGWTFFGTMINSTFVTFINLMKTCLYWSSDGFVSSQSISLAPRWLISFLSVFAVGLKPTWGLVPHTGAIGLAYMLDHVGPMAKNVQDCALLLEVSRRRNNLVIYTTDRYAIIWTAQLTSFVALTWIPRVVAWSQLGSSLTLRFLFSVAILGY